MCFLVQSVVCVRPGPAVVTRVRAITRTCQDRALLSEEQDKGYEGTRGKVKTKDYGERERAGNGEHDYVMSESSNRRGTRVTVCGIRVYNIVQILHVTHVS